MNNIKVTSNTVFAFDLHGVIFKLHSLQIIKEIIKCPYKFKLFLLIFYPKVLINTLSQLKNGAIAEEILLKLSREFPQFMQLLPTGFNIINAQKPIKGTVEIIEKLKSNGYKLYILSNIGEKSMDIMQIKFPEIFAHFDGIVASNSDDGYIKKPNPLAFEKYINKFKHNRSDIIFIDDRIKNIEAAQTLNIPSLLFRTSKQFYNDLKQLKVF